MMRRQNGFLMLAMVATLLITATIIFSIKMLSVATSKAGRSADLAGRMETVRQALVQYATVNSRLPCPADASALSAATDSGLANPVGAINNCPVQTNGIVPWATLGIPREASIDPWGRKLTYRVFDGASGLTRTNGLRCDTVLPNGSGYPDCATVATTWTVAMPTANTTDIAFVLVSHGPTGNGAWPAQGGLQVLPLPAAANTQERANYAYSAVATYYDWAQSDPSIDATAVNHFDDIVVYMTRAGLAQATASMRNWP